MFKNLRIALRMTLGFTLVLLALAGIVAGSAVNLSRLNDASTNIYERATLGTQHLAAAQNAMWELRFDVAQYNGSTDPAVRRRITEAGPQRLAAFDNALSSYELTATASETQALADLKAIYTDYRRDRPTWFELMQAGRTEEAAAFRAKTILASGAGSVKALTALIEAHTVAAKNISDAATRLVAAGWQVLGWLTLVAAVLALVAQSGSHAVSRVQSPRQQRLPMPWRKVT